MKKEIKILIIIIAILILILGIVVSCNKNSKTNNDNNKYVSKEEKNQDWVYNANYSLPVNKESYYGYSDHSRLVSAIDIRVPYINIDSTDAKNANNEIYNLYEKLIKEYNDNLKDEIWFTTVEYKTYINDDILSILITTISEGTDIPLYKYYTYNFDLNNGKLLSYEDVYKKLGYDLNKLDELAELSIEIALKEDYNESDFDTYKEKSINNYKNSVKSNNIEYYLDSNNKLNAIVTLVMPMGREEFDTIVMIDDQIKIEIINMGNPEINIEGPNTNLSISGEMNLTFNDEYFITVLLDGYCIGENNEKYLMTGPGSGAFSFHNGDKKYKMTNTINNSSGDIIYQDGTTKYSSDVDWSKVVIKSCTIEKVIAISDNNNVPLEKTITIDFKKEFE